MSLPLMTLDRPGVGTVLRFAIVGLGLVGLRHADAIASVAGAELVAVVDQSEAAQRAAALRGVPCYTNLAEMIAKISPDGLILATPTQLHVEQALQAIQAGIPVLVEKPIADEADSARTLVEAAKAADVAVLVGHHRRHNSIIRQAHSMIAEGRIGQVRAVHATCWFYKPDSYFEAAPWRKHIGAGPISVNLVHDIDLIRHLCGEIISVQAQSTKAVRGYENEDVACALLTFDNGAIGTISVSDSIVAPWSWEMTSKEYPIYPATSQSSYMIGGSHGSLSVPDLSLWTHSGERDWWSPISATSSPRKASDPLVNQIAHFVDVVANGVAPLVSGTEGLRTLAVVNAIQTSASTGKTIQFEVE